MGEELSIGDTRGWRRPLPARQFLARTLGVLAVTLVTFAGTVFFLTRAAGDDPREVVAAQLEALSHGDLARAYSYFSDSYRAGISLEEFRHLVATHRPLFRMRQVRFGYRTVAGDRAALQLLVTTLSGADYPLEYHLIYERGLWRIEDFRYHLGRASPLPPNARI